MRPARAPENTFIGRGQLLSARAGGDGADCRVDDLLKWLAVSAVSVHLAAAVAAGEHRVGTPGAGTQQRGHGGLGDRGLQPVARRQLRRTMVPKARPERREAADAGNESARPGTR
jgi:hypothetical protein